MKSSPRPSKYWQLTLWLGMFLTLAGLSAGFVTGQWQTPLTLMLLIPGGLILGAVLILRTAQPQFWRQRSTQTGVNTLISVVAMVLILTVVNLVAVQKGGRLDFTENQRYSLSPQSLEVVSNLPQPVKLWIFDEIQSDDNRRLLDNYKQAGGDKFTYELVDPRKDPAKAQAFAVTNFGELYLEVEGSGQPQRLQTLQRTGDSQQAISESLITNALARLNQDQGDRIYFLQGHGEYDLSKISAAVDRLQERGFAATPLNLAQTLAQSGGGLPNDAAVIILAGAKQPLFPQEVQALQGYLGDGGNVFLLIDPQTDPGVETLLNEWGISLDAGLVIDGGGGAMQIDQATGGLVGFGPTAPLVNEYGDHPITANFATNNSFYPFARAIVLTDVPGITATPLLLTSAQAWAEQDLQGEQLAFTEGEDLQGPLTLGAALSRPLESPRNGEAPNPDEATPPESRLVVIGNSTFMTNGLFSQQLNGDVFTNSVVWLSQREGEVLSISAKDPTNRRIQLKPTQARQVVLLSLIVLPLVGFGLGVFLWWKRR